MKARCRNIFKKLFYFKFLVYIYCFQESGQLLVPGSSSDYWTHGFPVKAFRENFKRNVKLNETFRGFESHSGELSIWNRKTLAHNKYHIYRQTPLHTHNYLKK